MLRVVLDTNIFVSSLLIKKSLPAQAVQGWRERRYLLITSPALISEVQKALNYDRIRRKYNLTIEDIGDLITLLEKDALIVPGTADVGGTIPADPDDEHVLACAVDGQADLIASGDKHLLELGAYEGIPIVTVKAFLEQI